MISKLKVFVLLLLVSALTYQCTPTITPKGEENAAFYTTEFPLLDSIHHTLSIEQKLGLSFIVTVPKDIDSVGIDELDSLIINGEIGGLFFEHPHPDSVRQLIQHFQGKSTFPLIYAYANDNFMHHLHDDILYSLSNEDSVLAYVENTILTFKNAGINCWMYEHIPTALKHKTTFDSLAQHHFEQRYYNIKTLIQQTTQNHNMILVDDNINAISLSLIDSFPQPIDIVTDFSTAASLGLTGISMSSLQYNIDTIFTRTYAERLKDSLNFDGLIFTKNIDRNFTTAFNQQSHIYIDEVSKIKYYQKTILQDIQASEEVSFPHLDTITKRVLRAKNWVHQSVDTLPVYDDKIASYANTFLQQQAVIFVKNDDQKVPIQNFNRSTPIVLKVGSTMPDILKDRLSFYDDIVYKSFTNINSLNLKNYRYGNPIILILNDIQLYQKDTTFIKKIAEYQPIVINIDNINNLSLFEDLNTIFHLHQADEVGLDKVAQVILGAQNTSGQLPYSISTHYLYGQKADSIETLRLGFDIPYALGLDPDKIKEIDAIAYEAIKRKAAPGLQVLIAKDGQIFYHKAFGHYTYDKKQRIKTSNIYDLASVTKITATTLAIMHLYDNDKLKLTDKVGDFLAPDSLSIVHDLTIEELLYHETGLQPNMPVRDYLRTRKPPYFNSSKSDTFSVAIADKFYLNAKWQDSIWYAMKTLPLERRGKYRYSDVNYNILQRVVEAVAQEPMDTFLYKTFYTPLGMNNTTYLPLTRFNKSSIVPTEKDNSWRKQLVHGYVHDESAALLGGVAGNAGLFSTANDLAILYQMLLNEGTYEGKRYLSKETILKFTNSKMEKDRGLGYDRRTRHNAVLGRDASLKTFGHTGFTGICVWADPDNDILYIFLSNRVYPRRNNRLSKYNIRQRIHQKVYDARLHVKFEN